MSDWVEWGGGVCPVDGSELVYVRYKNGEETPIPIVADLVTWSKYGDEYEVIAYRLHKPERPGSTPTERLRNAIAKRDKQAEKAQRHAEKLERREAEVQRLIGELEREIEEATGLVCCLAHPSNTAGDDAIPEGVDVDDPKTWKDGDVMECVDVTPGNTEYFTKNKEYIFNCIDSADVQVKEDDEGELCWMHQRCFRFVRRPS